MKRRTLLASLGAGVSGLAGCAGVFGGKDTDTLTPVSDVPTVTPQATPPNGQVDDPEVCGSSDGEYAPWSMPVRDLPAPPTEFSDLGCPTFSWAARTVCYHTANISAEPIVLVSDYHEAVVRGTTGEILRFALVNRSDQQITTYPNAWSILASQANGGEWETVRTGEPRCIRPLDYEDVHWWEVAVHTDTTADEVNVTAPTVLLDPGTYVFVISAATADGEDLACVAPFVVREGPDGVKVSTPEHPTTTNLSETNSGTATDLESYGAW